MTISENLKTLKEKLKHWDGDLIAVSKTYPKEDLLEAYDCGQRAFGENKVQELLEKQCILPHDIEWHLIGHLQRNKVKFIVPFVTLIHSIDSTRLLLEVEKQAKKIGKLVHCLLQVSIADEDTKFGLSQSELLPLLDSDTVKNLTHVKIVGLMGMATFTTNEKQVKDEFASLKTLFNQAQKIAHPAVAIQTLSMGMSGDYELAIEEGSTMIRVGSAIFGSRIYQ